MSEKLYINIQEPCHEDWNKMSPVQQGRFCGSCQKKVVDFTTQTDEEIISFFHNYNGSACGRFTDDQLQRPIQQIELKPASSFLKYAAGLLLPAFLFAAKSKAQMNDTFPKLVCSTVSNSEIMMLGKVSVQAVEPVRESGKITGRVVEARTKEPIAGVSVMIKGTKIGVATDVNGRFELTVSAKRPVIVYSSIGYETMEIKYGDRKKSGDIEVQMKPHVMGLMGEVIVVGYPTTKKGGVGGAVSVRTSSRVSIFNTIMPAKASIYPNPVAASGTVQLSFNNIKPGQYQIRLLNAAGQLFYSFQKQIHEKGDTEQLHLGNTIGAGVYLVQILDEKKKLLQSSKLIVQ
jgi:hypothetical protein